MKTIAFITRVKPRRHKMLVICKNSIRKQTNDDYIHIIYRGDKTKYGYGKLLANQSFAKIFPIDARYMMAIDDDDMLVDSDFVKIFKEIVDNDNPEIVFFKCRIEGSVYPKFVFWEKPPVLGEIGGSCFAIRLDVWKKYIHEFGKEICGDYCFISVCYKNTKKHIWLDRIISRTQRKARRGHGK